MATDFKEIEDRALKLDTEQRVKLARSLLASLEDEIDEDVEQAWIEEINRRKEEVESAEANTISAEKVLDKAKKLLEK